VFVTQSLVPLDGSQLAEQILEPALALGRRMHAEYTLLRIVEPLTLRDYDPVSARAHLSERTNEEVRREAESTSPLSPNVCVQTACHALSERSSIARAPPEFCRQYMSPASI
jgi:hypothetical protein